MVEKWANLDGRSVHYFVAGEAGSPVVLLHGGGVDSARLSWEAAVPSLARRHRVYAPDWPGYGQSDPLPGAYTTAALIESLDKLLDSWQVAQASLVGVSMGGAAALGFTLAFPRRVNKLVLVDTYGLQEKAPFHRLSYLVLQFPFLMQLSWASLRRSRYLTRLSLQNIFYDTSAVTPDLMEDIFQVVQQTKGQLSFYAWQRSEVKWSGLQTRYMDRLAKIKAPTLIVHGKQDRLVQVACARQAARLIPDSRLHIIDNCGHWPQRERPDEFNQVVSGFLE